MEFAEASICKSHQMPEEHFPKSFYKMYESMVVHGGASQILICQSPGLDRECSLSSPIFPGSFVILEAGDGEHCNGWLQGSLVQTLRGTRWSLQVPGRGGARGATAISVILIRFVKLIKEKNEEICLLIILKILSHFGVRKSAESCFPSAQ